MAHVLGMPTNQALSKKDEEDRAKLVKAGEKFLDEWVQTASSAGLPGEELLEEYKALIAKYTEERDANGYPWDAAGN